MTRIPEDEARYLGAALQAARVAREFLEWMESASERLAPERSAALAAHTTHTFTAPLREARAALDAAVAPAALAPFAERLAEGFADIEKAFELFTSFPGTFPPESITRILGALHHVARGQETFYLLRQALPPFADFWPPRDGTTPEPSAASDDASPTGVVHIGKGGSHGGFALYIPEHYTPERSWPVIVGLHGGSGNGRDFLWTWVREAKRFGYLLVAPTAVNDTWTDVDDQGLLQILAWLDRHYRMDRARVLLTGLSDGATFTLLYGLLHPEIYRALAPLCGVLHPANEMLGNLGRAPDVPIYLAHGALDFLFPVQLARSARDTLTTAGAVLEYRELPELSHTYPRSENVRILQWFEALPGRRDVVI
jgi:phospholipase/carboxylesterase